MNNLICTLAASVLLSGLAMPAGAESGWYLMAPPLAPPHAAQGTAPLTQWEQVGEFDSAKECARAQSRHFMHAADVFEALQKEMGRTGPRPKEFLDRYKAAADNYLQTRLARCIASNDPRLGR